MVEAGLERCPSIGATQPLRQSCCNALPSLPDHRFPGIGRIGRDGRVLSLGVDAGPLVTGLINPWISCFLLRCESAFFHPSYIFSAYPFCLHRRCVFHLSSYSCNLQVPVLAAANYRLLRHKLPERVVGPKMAFRPLPLVWCYSTGPMRRCELEVQTISFEMRCETRTGPCIS